MGKKKSRAGWWVAAVLLAVVILGETLTRCRGVRETPPVRKTGSEYSNAIVIGPGVREELSTVSIVQSDESSATDLTVQEIENLVRQAVDLAGGLRGVVNNGDTVVIKPNLVLMRENNGKNAPLLSPEANGITTDWRVARAVVKLVREINPSGKIYIMECTAVEKTSEVMKHLNYTPEYIPGVNEFIAIEEASGKWNDPGSAELVKVFLTNGLLHREYYLNRKFFEADVLISLPCLKTHSSAVVTGALKNTGIGATPANVYGMAKNNISKYNMVNHMNDDLHKWIRDYNLCKPINFVIMDGLQGLQNGPVHNFGDLSNDQMNMRLIIAGKDPVAVDTVEALLAGWDPESVNYLKYLDQARAGNDDIARIRVAGKRVDEVRKYLDGMIPIAGGRKIFDRDAPEFSVKGVTNNGGRLEIMLDAERKIRKVEVYVDGHLLEPAVTNHFEDITYTNDFEDGETHEVRICAYDRFLNYSEQTAELK